MARRILPLVVALCVACASGGEGPPPPPDAGGDGAVPDAGGDTGAPDADRPDTGPVGSCAGQDDGTPCDADGDGCTEDECFLGECVVGAGVDCGAGSACAALTCVSTGPTSHRCEEDGTTAGYCGIAGGCYADGDTNPANECQVCDADRTTSGWSDATTGCDDGDACTSGDTCGGGACTGMPMVDAYEPNDVRVSPRFLADISDGDDYPSGTFRATLYPNLDEDWFRFNDSDDFGGAIYPKVELTNVPTGSNYDLCAYVECTSGTLSSVTCTAGSEGTSSGLMGCCSRNGGNASETVRIDHDCSGTDDSAAVYIRVYEVGGEPTCAEYTVTWGDD